MKKHHSGGQRPQSKKPRANVLEVREQEELMKFLIAQLPHKNRNNIKSLLKRRLVLVDGKAISQFNHLLKPGQKVTIESASAPIARQMRGVVVVHEDKDLIVVNKNAGLLTTATPKEKQDTVFSILSKYVKEKDQSSHLYVVHRLDRETSGLMVFAKNPEVQELMKESWMDSIESHSYLAVIDGKLDPQEGSHQSYLFQSKIFKMHSSQDPEKGELAVTHYSTLKSNELYSMLKVSMETVHKNQVRVHLQDLKHPIIGDKKYGSKSNPIGRLGLHAWVLAFKHPVTGKNLRFETSVPGSFLKLF